jgi:hypothetical protein
MQRVTLKTSTIFIAKGDRTRVYHSVGEIPKGLRKELEESTNGFNSATILIADKRGREEVRLALNGMPSAFRARFAPRLEALPSQAPAGRLDAPTAQLEAPTVEPVNSVPWLLRSVSVSLTFVEAHGLKIAIPLGLALAAWVGNSLRLW